jgi:hypothetical protein
MSGAIPSLPKYTFMAWCSVKAEGQPYLLPCLNIAKEYFMFQLLEATLDVVRHVDHTCVPCD